MGSGSNIRSDPPSQLTQCSSDVEQMSTLLATVYSAQLHSQHLISKVPAFRLTFRELFKYLITLLGVELSQTFLALQQPTIYPGVFSLIQDGLLGVSCFSGWDFVAVDLLAGLVVFPTLAASPPSRGGGSPSSSVEAQEQHGSRPGQLYKRRTSQYRNATNVSSHSPCPSATHG